jgi:hypothetical protein
MSYAVKKDIEVFFTFEASHCWPDAPKPVAFLKFDHRHVFHCRARIEVLHDDRELEFILVKRCLEQEVKTWGFDLGSQSCEQMALLVLEFIMKKYGLRRSSVSVHEDGENGAVVSTE